jgi:glycosyltransferase involved in cell wall biosynthesis
VLARFAGVVRVVRQPNGGVAAARNRGVSEATGELIAFLDGDDRWHPEKLARQVPAYLRFPDSGLVACDVEVFDGEMVMSRNNMARRVAPEAAVGGVQFGNYLARMLQENFITSASQVVIPKAVLGDVGPADTSFRAGSDYEWYLRIAQKYPFTLVLEPHVRYRYVATSVSGPWSDRLVRWTPYIVKALTKHRHALPRELQRRVGTTLRKCARVGAALAYYQRGSGGLAPTRAYLLRLLVASRWDPVVALYAAGVLVPEPLHDVARALSAALSRALPVSSRFDGRRS